ncbi:Disease resistance protein L6 [Linum perenne]
MRGGDGRPSMTADDEGNRKAKSQQKKIREVSKTIDWKEEEEEEEDGKGRRDSSGHWVEESKANGGRTPWSPSLAGDVNDELFSLQDFLLQLLQMTNFRFPMQKKMEPCYLPLLIRENPRFSPSSSFNSALPVEYEVFLSFRGPDVRTTFADVLYKFLDHSKIRTFLDDEELHDLLLELSLFQSLRNLQLLGKKNKHSQKMQLDFHFPLLKLVWWGDFDNRYLVPKEIQFPATTARERVMDQQIWSFFWAFAALFLAGGQMRRKRPQISNGTSSSPSVENPLSAPSSSSNSALPVEYEVFLSFRGPDVRTTFVDVLYKFLDHSKIRTFLDDEELRKGEIIAPSLEKAIKESKVYIPILSQDYASSKWCLQELALMVKWCKQGDDRIILPIFYMMEPKDVRHQEGSYKKAFQLHSKKYDAETIKEWKEALKEVGEMKGWSVKESDRQGVIVDEVYSKVWSHLMRSYKLVTEKLVGIDSHVQQVTTLLSLESGGVKIVGIHAMGGMGKTTIAKAVYDQLYSQFDRFCFVEDAREILSKSDGVVTLQNKIISSILITDYKVKDASEGLRVINDRVCKHKVLVVLDDVNDSSQFDQIMGKLDNFSGGSRFIITTRDKWVLQVLQECEFYEPKEMNDDHALQLFSKHAFGIDVPPTDYATLSLEFVKVATGLPLALQVIGSLLFRRRESWASKLTELKEIPPTKLIERLEVSYKELTPNEKQIFLDIACFFIGTQKDFPFYMWSDCKFYPESGINILLLRSLIRFNERNEFWMHDHIRDIGRKIVREEDSQHSWNRSRIWSNEDALDILRNGQVASNLKAIHLMFCPDIRTAPDLSQCRNLEWIDLQGCDIGALENLHVLDAGNLLEDSKSFSPKIMNMPTSLNQLSLSFSRVLNLSELKDLEELCFDKCDKLQYLGVSSAAAFMLLLMLVLGFSRIYPAAKTQ